MKMLDGAVTKIEAEKAREILSKKLAADFEAMQALQISRGHYLERLVDDGSVPKGMKIQAVDVIDPTQSRVRHQAALGAEIDRVMERGEAACVVVFAPKNPDAGRTTSSVFHGYANPNRYAVVSSQEADRLLGNTEANQSLRNSMNHRVGRIADIQRCKERCQPKRDLRLP